MKKIIQGSAVVLMGLACAGVVSAHVTVHPKEAVAGYSVAVVRVPNEKDVATTQVRVVVPEGVDVGGVMPISGWTHTEKKEKDPKATPMMADDGDMESLEKVTEITWSGGKIGVGEFMEFPVSVKYSGDADTVTWKSYQTYAGGEVVAWDSSDEKKPAPVVTILKEAKVDSLEKNVKALSGPAGSTPGQMQWLSVVALLASVAALAVSMKKK